MREKTRPRAFTLIELLIVVSIIAILAVIAVPNFLEAQVRSKVARVKSDLRTMATALEAYFSDENRYPPVPMGLGPRFWRLKPLTTPIAYISDIPSDPFDAADTHGHHRGRFSSGMYAYGARPLTNASRWILASDGPDRRPSGDRLQFMFYPGYSPGLFFGQVEGFTTELYDPTNGTVSGGDIVRASDFQPQ